MGLLTLVLRLIAPHNMFVNNTSRGFCAVAQLSCSPLQMLLRMVWCRSGVPFSLNRKTGLAFASNGFVQTAQSHTYESKSRTQANLCGTWMFSGTRYVNACNKHQRDTMPFVGGLDLTARRTAPARKEQKRFYSSNIVKSMLKPTLKPPSTSGKRVPKGPRTKQPSRANQPALNEDQVDSQIGLINIFKPKCIVSCC